MSLELNADLFVYVLVTPVTLVFIGEQFTKHAESQSPQYKESSEWLGHPVWNEMATLILDIIWSLVSLQRLLESYLTEHSWQCLLSDILASSIPKLANTITHAVQEVRSMALFVYVHGRRLTLSRSNAKSFRFSILVMNNP